MKTYFTPLITALSIACSGAAQRQTDQFSEQAATNPYSYKSLTSKQIDECTTLFIGSEKQPALFHTASPACQDYAIRANMTPLADIVQKSYWFTEGFEAYYIKSLAASTLEQSNCLELMIDNSLHIPPLPSLYGTKEQEEKCKKAEQESNALSCIDVKKEYNGQLTKFETALQKAYQFLQARIPLASIHQDYQNVKNVIQKTIEENRIQTKKYVCQK